MSLGIVIKGPEGLVLAAESRLTVEATLTTTSPPRSLHVNFDNATKLLSFGRPHTWVGAVTYGAAAIGMRTAHSYTPEFEATLPDCRLTVDDYAQRLSDFFNAQWTQWLSGLAMPYAGQPMTLVVGGFDEGAPYGRLFVFDLPTAPTPREMHAGESFGMVWGGQRELVDRVVQGFDPNLPVVVQRLLALTDAQTQQLATDLQQELAFPLPFQALALQDCVDLALFFIRSTIAAQRLMITIRGCGGPIDVASITRSEGLRFVQRKEVTGELSNHG